MSIAVPDIFAKDIYTSCPRYIPSLATPTGRCELTKRGGQQEC